MLNRFLNRFPLIRTMFRRQDPMSKDIGQAGELLTAKLRVVMIAVLAINPTKSLIVKPDDAVSWAGFAVTLAALGATLFVLRLARRDHPPRSLPLLTSQFDIFMVTLGSISFIAAGDPIVATNSFIHWSYYMLGIGATCLRHDPRLVVLTVVSAIAELLLVSLFVSLAYPGLASPEYGSFSWDTQAGKCVALVVIGLLSVAIITRNRQVWETSVRDKLTGLHNRRFFDGILEFICFEHSRDRRPFCLAIIDVDHFKKVNDTLGHDAGDRALLALGRFMKSHFRSSDIPARWGGEEFAVVLPESDLAAAAARLEQFRRDVSQAPTETTITVSIGLASYPVDAETPEALVVAADQRLLAAKRHGRNRLVFQ